MEILLGMPGAVACMSGDGGASRISGVVRFYQKRGGVIIVAEISGLPPEGGFFAFHIHEGENCCGDGFPNTGGHYDPCGKTHPDHAGDLPPLLACGGRAFLAVLTGRFCLEDVIGRTVIIHSHADDFHTQPSGDAGSKIACGVIRRC